MYDSYSPTSFCYSLSLWFPTPVSLHLRSRDCHFSIHTRSHHRFFASQTTLPSPGARSGGVGRLRDRGYGRRRRSLFCRGRRARDSHRYPSRRAAVRGRWRVAARAALPAVHGRAVVPLPPPYLSTLSTASLRAPSCVLLGLGDQDEMSPWNERDSMNIDILLLPFVALFFLAVHRASEVSYTIFSLPPLSYEPVGMCVSSAP